LRRRPVTLCCTCQALENCPHEERGRAMAAFWRYCRAGLRQPASLPPGPVATPAQRTEQRFGCVAGSRASALARCREISSSRRFLCTQRHVYLVQPVEPRLLTGPHRERLPASASPLVDSRHAHVQVGRDRSRVDQRMLVRQATGAPTASSMLAPTRAGELAQLEYRLSRQARALVAAGGQVATTN
jgi:hypothetical protein